jgi:hypothetical protein
MASIILLFMFHSFALAQDDAIGMDESTMTSSQQQLDILDYYSIHQLDLRNITDEFLLLPGISPAILRSLKSLIKKYPDVDDIEELQNHFPQKIDSSIRRVLLMCTHLSSTQSRIHGKYRSRISYSLPSIRGIKEGAFQGSEEALMQRLIIGNKQLTCALSYGKHAGEAYEHGMFHGSLRYTGKNYMMIIGDHSIEQGMGSMLASGISIADIAKPTQRALRWSQAIRPTTSLIEHGNFRGIGGEYTLQHDAMNYSSGFSLSMRNRFANVNDEGMITSFPSITYARTENELQKRNAATEYRGAFYNSLEMKCYKFSLAAFYQRYEENISPMAYAIGEQEQFMTSLDIQSEIGFSWTLSSNVLFDKRFNLGGLLTLHHDGGKHEQAIMIRYFAPKIRPPLGQSFGRFGLCSNDMGLHILLNGKLGSMNYAFSSEVYSQIESASNTSQMRKGIRMIGQLMHASENITIIGRIMNEMRSLDKSSTYSQADHDWRIRSEIAYRGSAFKSVARVESHIVTSTATSFGIGCSLEFQSIKKDSPWNWSLRIAWSETDNFESAIYLPESGLPGQLLIDPLYGKGIISAGKIGYVFGMATISALIRQKYKPLESSLGSGLMRIDGNLETEFHLQTDITF